MIPTYDGGNPVNAYNIYIDNGLGGSLSYLATVTDLVTLQYTASNLVNSRSYNFAVSAVNQISEGARSLSTTILAATVPDPPA